jgi:hypothetical protein
MRPGYHGAGLCDAQVLPGSLCMLVDLDMQPDGHDCWSVNETTDTVQDPHVHAWLHVFAAIAIRRIVVPAQ